LSINPDKPSETYWELIALERKTALADVLEENKVVCKRNDKLEGEVCELKEKVNKY